MIEIDTHTDICVNIGLETDSGWNLQFSNSLMNVSKLKFTSSALYFIWINIFFISKISKLLCDINIFVLFQSCDWLFLLQLLVPHSSHWWLQDCSDVLILSIVHLYLHFWHFDSLSQHYNSSIHIEILICGLKYEIFNFIVFISLFLCSSLA